jgi:DNA excision repair protein ERCC-3
MLTHEDRGDKIIIFSDSTYALAKYSELFQRKAIYGQTSQKEREALLAEFRISSKTSTIFLSRVSQPTGDVCRIECDRICVIARSEDHQ